jgi:hypothetical protein
VRGSFRVSLTSVDERNWSSFRRPLEGIEKWRTVAFGVRVGGDRSSTVDSLRRESRVLCGLQGLDDDINVRKRRVSIIVLD